MKRIRSEERRVLSELGAISDAALRSWIDRGFMTVERLAKAELQRRAATNRRRVRARRRIA